MSDLADFSYALRAVRVVFADGALDRLGTLIDDGVGATRILLVSTPRRTAMMARARAALGDRVAAGFDGARVHVPAPIVANALRTLREHDGDCVLALGGGSAVGLGKALVKETHLPLVAVPTTYAGSEMTDIWGVTDGDRKQTGRDPRVAPRLVVYDPELTHDLPPGVTGPSGMNAIAHAVEALYSSTASPASSLLAAEGIRRLATSLPLLATEPSHRDARREALCGAHFCGRALDMTSMGLHHKLCHVLGGVLDLPHAPTHALVLPYVTAYNTAAAPRAMQVVADSLDTSDAAVGLWRLNRRLGGPATLADLGMTSGDVDRVVDEVIGQAYPNPAPVTAAGVRGILAAALSGKPPG